MNNIVVDQRGCTRGSPREFPLSYLPVIIHLAIGIDIVSQLERWSYKNLDGGTRPRGINMAHL